MLDEKSGRLERALPYVNFSISWVGRRLKAFVSAIAPPAARPLAGPAAARARAIYQAELLESAQRVDHSAVLLMLAQYVVCVLLALWTSQNGPAPGGSQSHLMAALILGGFATSIPVGLAIQRPGAGSTRYAVAAGQMLMSSLFITVMGGRAESHFHVFGSLAFLAFYRDWRVLALATVLVAGDHLFRGIYWPASIYGSALPQYWRWLEYTSWLVFEEVFLLLSIHYNLNTLEAMSQQRAELERARDVAEQASRAKDEFIATLSHELRTPLTPSLMTLSALAQDENLDEGLREELQMVQRNVELEARLIDDLLDLTRIAQGKLKLIPSAVDIHAILDHILETCRAEFGSKNLQIEFDLKASKHWISGDSARLQQVFWNLIKNAVKFTPEGGTITVRTSNEGARLRVDFADTGVGIAADVLPKIFNRFEQGGGSITRQFGGLGLGLSISRAILELHLGSIRAESKGAGRGSTFSVSLTPLAEAPSAHRGNETQILRLSGKLPRRLLLVDDHDDTRRTLDRLLTRAGYDVTTADCVQSALRKAQEGAFDLLLSDIGLPDGSGCELMAALRKQFGLRGIAFSGFGMEGDIQESLDAGFFAHVTKPIDLERLKQTMTQALSQPAPEPRPDTVA